MSAARRAVPPSAVAAGVTAARHAAEMLAGNEWCVQGRHYVRSTVMTSHSTATCGDCAAGLRLARKARKDRERTGS